MEAYPYRQVVGKLMYIAVCTRPDICKAVSELSRFNANPGLKHWESAMRVLRYLSGTSGVGLIYKRGASKDLWGYVDASHTSCQTPARGELLICSSPVMYLFRGPAKEWVVTH